MRVPRNERTPMADGPGTEHTPDEAAAARFLAEAQARTRAGDADGARRLLVDAARAGSLPAAMQLGAWELIGLGGPADMPLAIARLRDAADRGHASASTLYAQLIAAGAA